MGAGFGGLRAARALAKAPVRVTLLDQHNYHLFQPLLYQVATAGLTPEEIAANVYPQLTLAQVYAALAYYEDHRTEIDRTAEDETRNVEEFKQLHPNLVRDVRL